MKRRSEPSSKLQVHIPTKLKAEIERQAEAEGRLISTFVQRVLAAYIVNAKAATT